MLKALVPVDGSPTSARVVKHVVDFVKDHGPLELLLLNVQESVDAWEVRRFLPQEEIEAMQTSRGGDALQKARDLLDAAGVAYTPYVRIGAIAETIAAFAQEQHCDKIIMGTRGMSSLENLFLGGVATKVIHLTDIPVTLVK